LCILNIISDCGHAVLVLFYYGSLFVREEKKIEVKMYVTFIENNGNKQEI
jgi:hypothetical protein